MFINYLKRHSNKKLKQQEFFLINNETEIKNI